MQAKVLDGIKIFDFGWAVAGSSATKVFSDYGATVIKLESSTHVDFLRTNGFVAGTSKNDPDDKPFYAYLNSSKHSLGLDIKNPHAKEIITEYYKWADVVFENFSPGKIDQMGLGYEYAKTVNPDIIMCHVSIFGRTGPLAPQSGTDGMGSSMGCHRGMTGWPDREPMPFSPMVFGDVMLPMVAASAILAALDYKRRTGKGQELDLSMLDIIAMKATPMVMNLAANGIVEQRNGNRVAYAAPHGAYRCRGGDRWCAIAAYCDEDWKALRKAMGNPAWSMDPVLDTLEGRKAREDFLDEQISAWTAERQAEEVMEYLQSLGIPAGVVQNQEDLQEHDPLLQERDYYTTCGHDSWGTIRCPRPAFVLSKAKPAIEPAPNLGEDTFWACTELIGMSDEDFVKYDLDGAFR